MKNLGGLRSIPENETAKFEKLHAGMPECPSLCRKMFCITMESNRFDSSHTPFGYILNPNPDRLRMLPFNHFVIPVRSYFTLVVC